MKRLKTVLTFATLLLFSTASWAMLPKTATCPMTPRMSVDDIMTRFLDAKTYPNFYMVCGHRGMWYRYPENSAQALNQTISMGIDCIENDIRVTSDGVLVVFHDKQLSARLYNPVTGLPAKGTVPKTTWAELSKLRYLDRASNKTHYPVLTLKQFLDITNDKVVVNHEDKSKNPDAIRAMIQMIKDHGRLNQSIIKGRFTYAEYKKIIEGIVDERDVHFTPVIFADTPNYDQVFQDYWNAGYRNFELVIQKPNSPLLKYVKQVKDAGGRLGQFDVIPETGRGSFWVGQWRDPAKGLIGYDYRSDWDFLVYKSRADYFISDRPCLMTQYLAKIGLRETAPAGQVDDTDPDNGYPDDGYPDDGNQDGGNMGGGPSITPLEGVIR